MTIGLLLLVVIALFTSVAGAGGGKCNTTSQCRNGGTCYGIETVTNSSNITGVCRCAEKYTGDFCSIKCLQKCLNGGACIYTPKEHSQGNAGLSDFSCTCPLGWKGSTCSIPYIQCPEGNPKGKQCLHGATCARTVDANDDDTDAGGRNYQCDCDPDYEGYVCETLRTVKEKERLQDTTTASTTGISRSSKRFSGGESFGIIVGVGLAIGIIVAVLIMSRRRNKSRHAPQIDSVVLDMDIDGSSTMNSTTKDNHNDHDNYITNDNTTGNGVGNQLDLHVETVNDNEII